MDEGGEKRERRVRGGGMVVTVMDISQMPVVERRGGRGRRTSRGLDSGHATQLSLRQERRRRKGSLAKG